MQGLATHRRAGTVVLYAVAALLVVTFYLYARSQNEGARAYALYEQGRLVEARAAMAKAVGFDGKGRWRGYDLAEVAARLQGAIEALEERVRVPLRGEATDEERLGRARDLAMLNRTAEALAVLDSSPALADSAAACTLRGTVYETRGAWRVARQWYERGQDRWLARDSSPEQLAGLATALKGVALCERKLGRLPEAEASYQELVRRAPCAETHFLAAQFYEDTQQAKLAHFHARQAMLLDPQRYAEPARRLTDKLMTSHFGCFTVGSEP
jgi:tetratricopeptide (TPR) repeat protein